MARFGNGGSIIMVASAAGYIAIKVSETPLFEVRLILSTEHTTSIIQHIESRCVANDSEHGLRTCATGHSC